MDAETVEITSVTPPRGAGASRRGGKIGLVVLHSDPRPAEEALAAFVAPDATDTPHFYIAADGTCTRLLDESRASELVGTLIWQKRRRNIDRIGILITMEHSPGADYSDAGLTVLHRLLNKVQAEHDLPATALVRWTSPTDVSTGYLELYAPPPPPGAVEISMADLAGYISFDPAEDALRRLYVFLQQQSWSQRGATFTLQQAFSLFAAQQNLGAPLASDRSPPIAANNGAYTFQPFARDTICFEGRNWSAVERMNDMLDDAIPQSGLARQLLEQGYAASLKQSAGKVQLQGNQSFRADWRFHFSAMVGHLGPAVSGNYATADGKFAVQVFAADTLFTPMSDQANCFYLSQTEPDNPAYSQIWGETYKVAGAPYDPNSPFQQRAAQDKLGTPLSGVFAAGFEGTTYQIQVFGLDTLYAGPDGQIKRMSELPRPPEVLAFTPAPPRAPAPRRPAPGPAPTNPVAVAQPNVGAPARTISWPPKPNFTFLTSDAQKQQIFGAFEYVPIGNGNVKILGGWVAEHIVVIEIPQLAKFVPGGKIRFHKKAAAQMKALWAAWEAAGLLDRVLTYGGDFVPRVMRSNPRLLSNHAYGTAFDINVAWNGIYKIAALHGDKGSVRELVPLANAYGFYWGGHWNYDGKGASDGMHFEWAVPVQV